MFICQLGSNPIVPRSNAFELVTWTSGSSVSWAQWDCKPQHNHLMKAHSSCFLREMWKQHQTALMEIWPRCHLEIMKFRERDTVVVYCRLPLLYFEWCSLLFIFNRMRGWAWNVWLLQNYSFRKLYVHIPLPWTVYLCKWHDEYNPTPFDRKLRSASDRWPKVLYNE